MPRNPLQVQHVLETMQIQPSYLQVAKQVAGTSKAGRGRAEAAASFSGVLQRVWSELAAYDDWIELAVSDSDYAAMEFAFAMDFAKAVDPRQLPIFEKTPVVKLEGEGSETVEDEMAKNEVVPDNEGITSDQQRLIRAVIEKIEAANMQIFVKTLTGKTITLEVQGSDTPGGAWWLDSARCVWCIQQRFGRPRLRDLVSFRQGRQLIF